MVCESVIILFKHEIFDKTYFAFVPAAILICNSDDTAAFGD